MPPSVPVLAVLGAPVLNVTRHVESSAPANDRRLYAHVQALSFGMALMRRVPVLAAMAHATVNPPCGRRGVHLTSKRLVAMAVGVCALS